MKVWTDDYGIRASWSKSPWRQFHRRFILLISLGALVIANFDLAAGHWLVTLTVAICAAAGITYFAVTRPHLIRRPDYSLIARMEREIYGEAFSHDGAPEVAASTRIARSSCHCGAPALARGSCPDCLRRIRRDGAPRSGTGTTSTIHFTGVSTYGGGAGGSAGPANASMPMSDSAFLEMMAGATFGPGATIVMPSGKTVTGTEMTALLGLAQEDR